MKKHDQHNQTNDSEITELKKQIEEWKSKYVRALADYQNLERRTQGEKEEARRFASEVIIGRLLPAIDTLKRVKEHVNDVGFDLAYKEVQAVLQEQGVEHIEVEGRPFDPHEMECIEVAPGEDNIVVEELLPGYRLHGKVLRVAQVKVGKKSEARNPKLETN